jgi:alpha-L-rhamnosidase
MNSHNHAMFAGVSASLFTRLAGISALKPGFTEIGIQPRLPSTLSFVEATQETVNGQVRAKWQRRDGNLDLEVSVPTNAVAFVAVPASDRQTVTEHGQAATAADGVSFVGQDGDTAVFKVGSGNYRFSSTLPKRSTPNSQGIPLER